MEIPGYTILNKIGQGGMATVYLAIQESLDRQVALKVMHSTRVDEENFPERFLKEGRIIAQLQHPRIITVYDFGSHGLYNYFSMEFLSGGTLAQQIEQDPVGAGRKAVGVREDDGCHVGVAAVQRPIFARSLLWLPALLWRGPL